MAELLAIARSAGVTCFGSEKWPDGILVISPGSSGMASLVLRATNGGFGELYAADDGGTVKVQIRPVPDPEDPRRELAVFGDETIPSCAIWVRSSIGSALMLPRDDISSEKVTILVSNTGVLTAPTIPSLPRKENVAVLGSDRIVDTNRVWVKSAPGRPSALVLQSPNGTPWAIWIDADGTLRATNWETFLGGQPALVISTTTLPGGTNGAAYTTTLSSSGGTPPVVWAVSAGTLPAGLTLNANTGVIAGTPTAAGTSNFTVRATAGTETVTKALSIVVA